MARIKRNEVDVNETETNEETLVDVVEEESTDTVAPVNSDLYKKVTLKDGTIFETY